MTIEGLTDAGLFPGRAVNPGPYSLRPAEALTIDRGHVDILINDGGIASSRRSVAGVESRLAANRSRLRRGRESRPSEPFSLHDARLAHARSKLLGVVSGLQDRVPLVSGLGRGPSR
jgi:hypothetical protein